MLILKLGFAVYSFGLWHSLSAVSRRQNSALVTAFFFCKNYAASYTQIFSPKASDSQNLKHKASFCLVHTFSGTPCLWKYKQYWGKGERTWLGRKPLSHRQVVLEGRSTLCPLHPGLTCPSVVGSRIHLRGPAQPEEESEMEIPRVELWRP